MALVRRDPVLGTFRVSLIKKFRVRRPKFQVGSSTLLAGVGVCVLAATLVASQTAAPAYDVERLVEPSSFHGVHGLRFDKDGMLLAASVIGQTIYKVDTATGRVTPFIGPRQGMADDLAIAPDGTMVWTAIEDGIVYGRTPGGQIRRLMENQRGVNAVSFTPDGKRLFVSLVFYGDALYEVDPAGVKPPRRIAEQLGGLNGFDIGRDGQIYGPLWFKGQVVRVNPGSGAVTTVADGFTTPAALKFDPKGNAWVLDTGSREIVRLNVSTGEKRVVAMARSNLDNLAFDAKGRLFVSLSRLNAIDEVNVETGATREVVPAGALISTAGIGALSDGGRDVVYVADVFGGVRQVDGLNGDVTIVPTTEIGQPSHVSVTPRSVIVVSQLNGIVQQYDQKTGRLVVEWKSFRSPGDAVEEAQGRVLVAETGTGTVVRVTMADPARRDAVAKGLGDPSGLALDNMGRVYVTETRAGQLSRLDLGTGRRTVVASGLQAPEGVAVLPDGAIAVVEVGAKRVTRIDPAGMKSTIAEGLPIGLGNGPSLFRGLAATPSAIYVASDVENSIYRLSPRRP
jgi:sugar lactone lactonase YvrE